MSAQSPVLSIPSARFVPTSDRRCSLHGCPDRYTHLYWILCTATLNGSIPIAFAYQLDTSFQPVLIAAQLSIASVGAILNTVLLIAMFRYSRSQIRYCARLHGYSHYKLEIHYISQSEERWPLHYRLAHIHLGDHIWPRHYHGDFISTACWPKWAFVLSMFGRGRAAAEFHGSHGYRRNPYLVVGFILLLITPVAVILAYSHIYLHIRAIDRKLQASYHLQLPLRCIYSVRIQKAMALLELTVVTALAGCTLQHLLFPVLLPNDTISAMKTLALRGFITTAAFIALWAMSMAGKLMMRFQGDIPRRDLMDAGFSSISLQRWSILWYLSHATIA
ncbi:hypothetical protein BSLG_001811 [Batrachochytrium salamandrivorans]|nr:hypothetical protein BSLG_001811 [Batrachochytrium salamandrivorans]